MSFGNRELDRAYDNWVTTDPNDRPCSICGDYECEYMDECDANFKAHKCIIDNDEIGYNFEKKEKDYFCKICGKKVAVVKKNDNNN